MEDKEKITTDYYKKYVGQYAKRFYKSFEEKYIYKIAGFKLKKIRTVKGTWSTDKYAYFKMVSPIFGKWEWDVEDCVIITDETIISDDNRVANVADPEYVGYNPFKI